jgi:hypothetical protein
MTVHLVAEQYAQMHQNLFKASQDIHKYLFYNYISGCVAVYANASEFGFNNLKHKKKKKILPSARWPNTGCERY